MKRPELHPRNMARGEVLRERPKALHTIFESPITVGALCAIVLNIFLPEEFLEQEEDAFAPKSRGYR